MADQSGGGTGAATALKVRRGEASSLLSLRGVSKTFEGTQALQDVDLDIAVGEIHALVGQNGSGKSTLVKILAGYHWPDRPTEADLRGTLFPLGDPRAASKVGLRFVHQDLALIGSLNSVENLTLITGQRPWIHRIDWRKMKEDTQQALSELGYDFDVSVPVNSLTQAERTAVALARALRKGEGDVRLLVLDEPTAALPGPEVDRLFAALRAIAARDVSVLFISHHLQEVLTIADRVTVFRDGKRLVSRPTRALSKGDLADLMLGRKLSQDLNRRENNSNSSVAENTRKAPVLELRGIGGQLVQGLDLDMYPGQIVGLTGLTGSGVEEVADLIFGSAKRVGEVRVDGKALAAERPRDAIAAGIAFVPADRVGLAIIGEWSVGENLTLPRLRDVCRWRLLNRRAERAQATEWLERLGVVPRRSSARISELSGGNQQKVVLARWMRMAPRVLVLEEPTSGVDVGAKADIHELIDRSVAGGAAVIVCSSDAPELARLCSSVLVLVRGRVVERLVGAAVTPENIDRAQMASSI